MFITKRISWMVGIILLGISIVGCSAEDTMDKGGNASHDKEVIEMDISNYNPSTHPWGENVYEAWKEYVEDKTDGRVQVNVYHGGSLGGSDTVYQDVQGGMYDVGLVVASYVYDTDFFPYTIGSLPFAFTGAQGTFDVLGEFGDEYAKENLKDIVIMGVTSTDAYDIFSNKPIRTATDLRGLSMRVNGKSEPAFVKALGGVPVSLVTEEIYEGLQKGTIDTAFYTPIGAVGMKMYEPGPYITKLGTSVTPIIPVMNKDFFDSLPEDLKELFEEDLNPRFAELFTETYSSLLEESYVTLEDEVSGRGEIITLEDEEMTSFKEAGAVAWENWIEDADEKGYDGQAMVEGFTEMLEEHGYPNPFE